MKRKFLAPIIITICIVCLVVIPASVLVWVLCSDNLPIPIYAYFLLVLAVLCCILAAAIAVLRQRIREMKRGEIEDAVTKY